MPNRLVSGLSLRTFRADAMASRPQLKRWRAPLPDFFKPAFIAATTRSGSMLRDSIRIGAKLLRITEPTACV